MPRSTLQLNTHLGPYYLVKLIAIGGMAEIYLATSKGVEGYEKRLALKVIHPDYADDHRFVQMLVDEAKIAVQLNHPNIAQTFDLGRIGHAYFISMEYVEGADFFNMLKRTSEQGRQFPVAASLLVVHEALRGLDYAHRKKDEEGQPMSIIHRDVSPQNILISRQGEVKLVDFGIAKAATLSSKTRSGVIKGKLVYMSPEQSWGEDVDQRSDIFSAGIVLYEALTGGSLYLEKNPVKLLEMVRQAAIPAPSTRRGPEITPELDDIVMRALSPRPEGRYATAQEFADAVAAYLAVNHADYSALDLSRQLLTVVGETTEPQPLPVAPQKPAPAMAEGAMRREDFAVPVNSIIFSAEDMMESQLRLPRVGGETAPDSKLVLLDQDGETAWPLADEFVLGRAGDLRLGDARVSRQHAKVYQQGGVYLVTDLGSSNGTFLNEVKLEEPRPLSDGDVVRVGPFKMRFEQEAPAPPSVPEPPPRITSPQPPPRITAPQPPPQAPPQAQLPATAPLPSLSVSSGGPTVTLSLGSQSLTLPVGDHLPLGEVLEVAGQDLAGTCGVLVRRPDGHWLEPLPGHGMVRLNGRDVTVPARLKDGDQVAVGATKLEYHA